MSFSETRFYAYNEYKHIKQQIFLMRDHVNICSFHSSEIPEILPIHPNFICKIINTNSIELNTEIPYKFQYIYKFDTDKELHIFIDNFQSLYFS